MRRVALPAALLAILALPAGLTGPQPGRADGGSATLSHRLVVPSLALDGDGAPADDPLHHHPAADPCAELPQSQIELVTDGIGNRQTNSLAKGSGTGWPGGGAVEVGPGTVLNLAVTVESECDVEYRYLATRNLSDTVVLADWSNRSHVYYALDGLGLAVLTVQVRQNRPDHRYVDGVDDLTTLAYSVVEGGPLPSPTGTCVARRPTIIDSVSDGIGHVQAASFGKGLGGDWLSDIRPPVSVGTVLSIAVSAHSDCPVSYQFLRRTSTGSLEVIQGWSPVSTVRYTVVPGDGPVARIVVQVRDLDPKHRYGSTIDDYTYLTYGVEP